MKKFQLVLIVENQSSPEKAKELAERISETIMYKSLVEISEYDKFENAFRIAILGEIGANENGIEEVIKLTDLICSPWLITYQKETEGVELFFNKTRHSHFRKDDFNVIVWGNLEMINQEAKE